MRLSFIYLIGPESGFPIKIGHATSVTGRLSALQMGCWEKLKIHHTITVTRDIAADVERRIHHKFGADRLRGEWYSVTVETASAALEELLKIYDLRLERQHTFSMGRCIALAQSPANATYALSHYRNAAKVMDDKRHVERLNRAILDEAGMEALVTFTQSVVEGRDLGLVLYRTPHLQRAAEAAVVRALDVLSRHLVILPQAA
jgi:hypothetical protein